MLPSDLTLDGSEFHTYRPQLSFSPEERKAGYCWYIVHQWMNVYFHINNLYIFHFVWKWRQPER